MVWEGTDVSLLPCYPATGLKKVHAILGVDAVRGFSSSVYHGGCGGWTTTRWGGLGAEGFG